MTAIEIDFEDFKRLTALRQSEEDSYGAVINRLLNAVSADGASRVDHHPAKRGDGFWIKDLQLVDGTELSAFHKHKTYYARIEDGQWVNEDGQTYGSASAAARAVTGNNVNGLRFWSAKKPGSIAWRRLDTMMPA